MSNVLEVASGIWNITPGEDSAAFLITGAERALLIDTSFGRVKLMPIISELTTLPVTLVNTHGHGDHVGGNSEFSQFYMHPLDIPIMNGDNANAIPITDGFVFELGGRSFEVVHIPGHSPGSIALLDSKNRVIFTGDMLAGRPVYFVPGESNGEAYISSMNKLEALSPDFDTVICSHGQTVMDKSIILRYKAAMCAFLKNELPYTNDIHMGTKGRRDVRVYNAPGGIGFIYPLN